MLGKMIEHRLTGWATAIRIDEAARHRYRQVRADVTVLSPSHRTGMFLAAGLDDGRSPLNPMVG